VDLEPLNSNSASGFGKIATGSAAQEGTMNGMYDFWRSTNPAGVLADYTETRRIQQLPILGI